MGVNRHTTWTLFWSRMLLSSRALEKQRLMPPWWVHSWDWPLSCLQTRSTFSNLKMSMTVLGTWPHFCCMCGVHLILYKTLTYRYSWQAKFYKNSFFWQLGGILCGFLTHLSSTCTATNVLNRDGWILFFCRIPNSDIRCLKSGRIWI